MYLTWKDSGTITVSAKNKPKGAIRQQLMLVLNPGNATPVNEKYMSMKTDIYHYLAFQSIAILPTPAANSTLWWS